MLSTATSLAPAPLLDLHQDNWSTWNQSLKLLCFTKFGFAGNQILSDRLIPLYPSVNEPTKNDLDPADTPIPGQYIYQRHTPNEGEPAGNQLLLPLSTQGNINYRDDKKIFNDAKLIAPNLNLPRLQATSPAPLSPISTQLHVPGV